MVATARGLSSAAARRLAGGQALVFWLPDPQRERVTNCSHLDAIRDVEPGSEGCQECARSGQRAVALRKCLSCGHVGCCDSSPGRHARAHFHSSGHPLIEPLHDAGWTWCYVDDAYVERPQTSAQHA